MENFVYGDDDECEYESDLTHMPLALKRLSPHVRCPSDLTTVGM